jgi:head-tail adaptor
MSAINVQAPGWERLYPHRCRIEAQVTTRNERHTATTDWAPVAGLESVPCAVSVLSGSEGTIAGVESSQVSHSIKLRGSFLVKRQHRAVVTRQNGEVETYSIEAVAHTSGQSRTKLFASASP